MGDSPHIAIQLEIERVAINSALYRDGHEMAIFLVDYRDCDYALQAFNESRLSDDDAMAIAFDMAEDGHPLFVKLMSFLERNAPCEFHRINNMMVRRCIVRNIKMKEE